MTDTETEPVTAAPTARHLLTTAEMDARSSARSAAAHVGIDIPTAGGYDLEHRWRDGVTGRWAKPGWSSARSQAQYAYEHAAIRGHVKNSGATGVEVVLADNLMSRRGLFKGEAVRAYYLNDEYAMVHDQRGPGKPYTNLIRWSRFVDDPTAVDTATRVSGGGNFRGNATRRTTGLGSDSMVRLRAQGGFGYVTLADDYLNRKGLGVGKGEVRPAKFIDMEHVAIEDHDGRWRIVNWARVEDKEPSAEDIAYGKLSWKKGDPKPAVPDPFPPGRGSSIVHRDRYGAPTPGSPGVYTSDSPPRPPHGPDIPEAPASAPEPPPVDVTPPAVDIPEPPPEPVVPDVPTPAPAARAPKAPDATSTAERVVVTDTPDRPITRTDRVALRKAGASYDGTRNAWLVPTDNADAIPDGLVRDGATPDAPASDVPTPDAPDAPTPPVDAPAPSAPVPAATQVGDTVSTLGSDANAKLDAMPVGTTVSFKAGRKEWEATRMADGSDGLARWRASSSDSSQVASTSELLGRHSASPTNMTRPTGDMTVTSLVDPHAEFLASAADEARSLTPAVPDAPTPELSVGDSVRGATEEATTALLDTLPDGSRIALGGPTTGRVTYTREPDGFTSPTGVPLTTDRVARAMHGAFSEDWTATVDSLPAVIPDAGTPDVTPGVGLATFDTNRSPVLFAGANGTGADSAIRLLTDADSAAYNPKVGDHVMFSTTGSAQSFLDNLPDGTELVKVADDNSRYETERPIKKAGGIFTDGGGTRITALGIMGHRFVVVSKPNIDLTPDAPSFSVRPDIVPTIDLTPSVLTPDITPTVERGIDLTPRDVARLDNPPQPPDAVPGVDRPPGASALEDWAGKNAREERQRLFADGETVQVKINNGPDFYEAKNSVRDAGGRFNRSTSSWTLPASVFADPLSGVRTDRVTTDSNRIATIDNLPDGAVVSEFTSTASGEKFYHVTRDAEGGVTLTDANGDTADVFSPGTNFAIHSQPDPPDTPDTPTTPDVAAPARRPRARRSPAASQVPESVMTDVSGGSIDSLRSWFAANVPADAKTSDYGYARTLLGDKATSADPRAWETAATELKQFGIVRRSADPALDWLGPYVADAVAGSEFGGLTPEQNRTIAEALFNHDLGNGYRSVISSVGDGSASGTIISPSGAVAGSFSRTFSASSGTVYHSIFRVYRDHSGSGVGASFIALSQNAYEQAGFNKVSVHALSSTGSDWNGGFTWARLGFNWDGAHYGQAMDRLMRMKNDRARGGPDAAITAELDRLAHLRDIYSPGDAFYPTAADYAMVGWNPRRKRRWFGKTVMSNHADWNGSKRVFVPQSVKDRIASSSSPALRRPPSAAVVPPGGVPRTAAEFSALPIGTVMEGNTSHGHGRAVLTGFSPSGAAQWQVTYDSGSSYNLGSGSLTPGAWTVGGAAPGATSTTPTTPEVTAP